MKFTTTSSTTTTTAPTTTKIIDVNNSTEGVHLSVAMSAVVVRVIERAKIENEGENASGSTSWPSGTQFDGSPLVLSSEQ